eukprot:3515664-Prymnesium_polylepis.1
MRTGRTTTPLVAVPLLMRLQKWLRLHLSSVGLRLSSYRTVRILVDLPLARVCYRTVRMLGNHVAGAAAARRSRWQRWRWRRSAP